MSTSPLIVAAAMFVIWYCVCRAIARTGPWGKLEKIYRSSRYVSLSQSREAQSSVSIGKSYYKDCYIVAVPDGVLFCGSYLGRLLGLQRSFLIPWRDLHVTAKRAPFLNSLFYEASVGTDEGPVSFNLFPEIVAAGILSGQCVVSGAV